MGKIKDLGKLGISAGPNLIKICDEINKDRILKVVRGIEKLCKMTRQVTRNIKISQIVDIPEYGAEMLHG